MIEKYENINEGDFLTCKKSFYDGPSSFLSFNRINISNSLWNKFSNIIFRKPLFKKGLKYKIDYIEKYSIPDGQFRDYLIKQAHQQGIRDINPEGYSCTEYYIKDIKINEKDLNLLFYSKKEIRKLKLHKIKKQKLNENSISIT
jgi:hypothetical protein